MSVFAIRSLCTTDFYAFRRINKYTNKCITKVVYFNEKKDAEKFASYLASSEFVISPQLYEYDEVESQKAYHGEYSIYEMSKSYMRLMLGLADLGYHECEIVDGNVICRDSGKLEIDIDTRASVYNMCLENS